MPCMISVHLCSRVRIARSQTSGRASERHLPLAAGKVDEVQLADADVPEGHVTTAPVHAARRICFRALDAGDLAVRPAGDLDGDGEDGVRPRRLLVHQRGADAAAPAAYLQKARKSARSRSFNTFICCHPRRTPADQGMGQSAMLSGCLRSNDAPIDKQQQQASVALMLCTS